MSRLAIVISALLLCVYAVCVRAGDDVIPVNQCFEQNVIRPPMSYYWICLMNCASANATYTYKITDANNNIVQNPTQAQTRTGWSCPNNVSGATGIAIPVQSVFSGRPFPWTITVTSAGGTVHTTTWNGCESGTDPACSPAGQYCVANKHFTAPPTCP